MAYIVANVLPQTGYRALLNLVKLNQKAPTALLTPVITTISNLSAYQFRNTGTAKTTAAIAANDR